MWIHKVLLSVEQTVFTGSKVKEALSYQVRGYLFRPPSGDGYALGFYLRNRQGAIIVAHLLELLKDGKQIKHYVISPETHTYLAMEKGAYSMTTSSNPAMSNIPFYLTNKATWKISQKGGEISYSISVVGQVVKADTKQFNLKMHKVDEGYWIYLHRTEADGAKNVVPKTLMSPNLPLTNPN